MIARVGPAVGPLALGLVLPPLVLLIALFLRVAQPIQYEPAATAHAFVQFFGGLPRWLMFALLIVGPIAALALAGTDQWHRWQHDPAWRSDVTMLAEASHRILRRPRAVMTALALLGSALWLALVVMHAIAG